MMMDVMVDIETLGTQPGCVILSIGARTFNPHVISDEGEEFYQNICPVNARDQWGFSVDPKTVDWWKKQSEEAKKALQHDRIGILNAFEMFSKWFSDVGGQKIWCQGANFDAPLIEEAMKRLRVRIPWKFYNVRDTRTVYDICHFDPYSIRRDGVYHNALDDCKHQIHCVQTALKKSGR